MLVPTACCLTKASSVEMPKMGRLRTWAMVLAVVMPRRMPVYPPGPWVRPMAVMSERVPLAFLQRISISSMRDSLCACVAWKVFSNRVPFVKTAIE